jgi:transcription-repair coupling factor (superfamily II helicase)
MLEKLILSPALRKIAHHFQSGDTLLMEGLWNSPKASLAALASKATGKHVLILTGTSPEEVRLFHDFKLFSDRPVLDFPAWETLPSENIPPSPDIVGERYSALNQIRVNPQPHIIISSLQACLQKLMPPEKFEALTLLFEVGKPLKFQETIDRLIHMGYRRESTASDKGEFAVRGGIIDLFPVSTPDPYRLEFWGDELESLRTYDPIGQKSIQSVERVEIMPGQELELIQKESRLSSILDYLGANTLIIFDDLLALEDRYASLMQIGEANPYFFSINSFLDEIGSFQKMYLPAQALEELSEVHFKTKPTSGYYSAHAEPQLLSFELFNRTLEALRIPSPFKTLQEELLPHLPHEEGVSGEDLLRGIESLPKESFSLYFLCDTEAEEARFQEKIVSMSLKLPKKSHFQLGYLSSGFVLEDIQTALFPLTEITQRYKIRRQKQRSTYHTTYSEVHELKAGDLVVHYNHGIGKFLGIEKQPDHQGVVSEFFQIEYADSGKLYVPLAQTHLLNKYVGAHEEMPKLHVLGSARWKRTRDATQEAIVGYATELLEVYAKREMKGGFEFKEDSPDLTEFEEEFPFVETEDQLNAIREVKEDMRSPKAMDRLICGDVGYGKTEVAMRAAFKAVTDGGKQVAILVPTTVLAMQHYENFVERMTNFPIRIGVLSRFRTPKQTRTTLKEIAEGSCDILVGTHRIISKDVQFKDLGLVIIDEEQRFGVKAKEHLKKIKAGVDCLTLTATPIPRTLYMSLVGAKDMSVINSPPQDRLPIKSIIAEPDMQLIKSAILRELARDGQVFFIHNRVETIYETASRLKELLPHARILVGHGQMHADEIDLVFHTFKRGQADILVATSIIENGIDIPNANTILIDRADRFGLADLYQIRGRVGRWNRRAYAYFLVPRFQRLPEVAQKRMQALAESSGYGSGMKVAMRDLEIRGAGNILGVEQSGHVSSIGFHLYCKLLKRTIQSLQGKLPRQLAEVKIDFAVDARLPESYISEVPLRLEIYQRLGEALSLDEVDEIWREVYDRYGTPPEAAEWLYQLTRLKVFAQLHSITLVKKEKMSVSLEQRQKGKNIARSFLLPQLKKPSDITDKLIPLLS